MSKSESIVFLILTSLSLLCIFSFFESSPIVSMSAAVAGSVGSLYFLLIAFSKSLKTKSPHMIYSLVGLIWSSICVYLVFTIPMNESGSRVWGIFSLIYAIPFAAYSFFKSKSHEEINELANGNLEAIKKLHELFKAGAITEDEFNQKKSDFL
jgi:hypothetical protein